MGTLLVLAGIGVAIVVLIGWLILAGSAGEIFREW